MHDFSPNLIESTTAERALFVVGLVCGGGRKGGQYMTEYVDGGYT